MEKKAKDILREGIEWDGRKLQEAEDGSIVITLNRTDMLNCTRAVYKEYQQGSKIGKDTFPEWLNKEIIKEEKLKKNTES